jgi:hypothetical protein
LCGSLSICRVGRALLSVLSVLWRLLALVLPLLVCWLLGSAGLLCSLLPGWAGLGLGALLAGWFAVAAVLLAPGLLWASLSCELPSTGCRRLSFGSVSALLVCQLCWLAGWLAP